MGDAAVAKPHRLGIDIVVHSVSKYLSGHSDVVGGCVIGSREVIRRIFQTELMPIGGVMPPMQAWLVMRGLRTLAVRLPQHERNTRAVIEYLSQSPLVESINYPLYHGSPYLDRAQKYLRGGSGLLSFALTDRRVAAIERFVDALTIPKIAVSWGGYESLVFPQVCKVAPGTVTVCGDDRLIRLHVGLEPVETIIADIDHALGGLR